MFGYILLQILPRLRLSCVLVATFLVCGCSTYLMALDEDDTVDAAGPGDGGGPIDGIGPDYDASLLDATPIPDATPADADPCVISMSHAIPLTWNNGGDPNLGNSSMQCGVASMELDACCDGPLTSGGTSIGIRQAIDSHPFCAEVEEPTFYLEYRVYVTANICPANGVSCTTAGQGETARNMSCRLLDVVDEVGGLDFLQFGGDSASGDGVATWAYQNFALRMCVARTPDVVDHVLKWEFIEDINRPAASVCPEGMQADCYCAPGP